MLDQHSQEQHQPEGPSEESVRVRSILRGEALAEIRGSRGHDPAVTGQRDEPRSSSKVRRASHSPHVADNVKQHEIGAIQDGDDDEEDSEQNTDEEHQSLDHHTWTQTQSHMRE